MPRRLAAWLQVKILSAGSVVSGGANLLPFGAGLFQRALVVHGGRILNRWIPSMLGALVRKCKPSFLLLRDGVAFGGIEALRAFVL